MLCLCALSPEQWVSWAELEGCSSGTECRHVLLSVVPALSAKAEELAWRIIT